MKTDELLIAQIEDKIRQADDWGMLTSGDFLDIHERKVVAVKISCVFGFQMYSTYSDRKSVV